MAYGIAIPIRTQNGRVVIEAGDDQLRKVVFLVASPGDNANPFHKPGIIDPTYGLNTPGSRGRLNADIRRHFASLERDLRARLLEIKSGVDETTSQPEVVVRWMNLKTDREDEVTT